MDPKGEDNCDDHPSHPVRKIESAIASWRSSDFGKDSKTIPSIRAPSSTSSKPNCSHHSQGSDKSYCSPSGVLEHDAISGCKHEYDDYKASVSISRDENSRDQFRMRRHEKANPDKETEFNIDNEDNQRSHVRSSTSGINDEDEEETMNETSFEETSFNTLYSDKGNDSSSELSIDPVVWKKFKFLSSILKETQHNLRAMDDLILEHRRLQDLANLQSGQSRATTAVSHSSFTTRGLGDGEPKTDEAKLEEILSLLHNLTQTLASYEQHPLLASTLHPARRNEASHNSLSTSLQHVQQTPHWLDDINKGHKSNVSDTYDHPARFAATVPGSHQPSHQQSQQPPLWSGNISLDRGPAGKTTDGYNPLGRLNDNAVSSPGTDVNRSFSRYTDGTSQSFHTINDHTGLPGIKDEDTRSAYPANSPHCSVIERSIDKSASINDIHSMSNDTLQYSRFFTNDSNSQTDYIPVASHVTIEYPEQCHADVFHYQNGLHNNRLDNIQNQDHPPHPLMKETRSLRKDIDDIMVRKQALDSRLQSLIAHRATQKELKLKEPENSEEKQVRLVRSHSLEEIDNRKLKSRNKRYKNRSKSYEEETNQQIKAGTTMCETYLSMISEDQNEFPSLTMESLENEEKITELQHDEADLPGLGDSGLSSEINSINATIQELIKENQQLHKFLQGMTCESILKVDQEKLALEARIKLLNEENQSLKMTLKEDNDTETAETSKYASKAVTFLIAQTNEEHERTVGSKDIMNTNMMKNKDDKHISNDSTCAVTNTVDQGFSATNNELNLLNKEESLDCAKTETLVLDDTKSDSKANFDQLNWENPNLFKTEKERKKDECTDQVTKKFSSLKEVEREAKEGQMNLKDHVYVENLGAARAVEKLSLEIKKLREEKEDLHLKFSEEVSKRDLESVKLEEQIQFLSERNQHFAQKLDIAGNEFGVDKAEKSCQTESVNYQVNSVFLGSDGDSITTVIDQSVDSANSQTAVGVITNVMAIRKPNDGGRVENIPVSSSNKTLSVSTSNTIPMGIADNSTVALTENVASEAYVDRVINKGFTDMNKIDLSTNILSFNDNSGSIENTDNHIDNKCNESTSDIARVNRTTKNHLKKNVVDSDHPENSSDVNCFSSVGQDIKSSVIENDNIFILSGNIDGDNESAANITCLDHNQCSGMEDDKFIPQLEELVRQNEVIASGLNDLKSSAMTSESYLECTMMKIMEKYGKILQNIDERLSSGQSFDKSEFEAKVIKLVNENQELISTLEKQQKRIDILTYENNSLKKKCHLAHKGSKENCNLSDEGEAYDNVTPLKLHMVVANAQAIREVEIDQEMKDISSETEGNKMKVISAPPDKEANQDLDYSATNLRNFVDVMKLTNENLTGDESELLPMKEAGRQLYTHTRSSDPSDSRTLQNGIPEGGSAHQLNRKSSQCSIKEAAADKNIGAESKGQLNLTLRREKENWTQMLRQAENEKEVLQDRIVTLVNENDCLATRLEEVVSVSRNLSDQMNSAREQLFKVTAENDDLQEKIRSLEDGKNECSLSLSDSAGSSQLAQQLRERIRNLQSEVEQAWQEVHQRTMEKDKIFAEKESFQYTSNISLKTAKEENEMLKSQIAALQEDKGRLSIELANIQNELEKKSADVRARIDNHANQSGRLIEAKRRIEDLQKEVIEKQEQLQNEKEEKKSAEAQLDEIKKLNLSSTSHHGSSAGKESTPTQGERHWLETVTRLKGQLHQEQLRSRLLEAAEQESSTRILILQRSIRETIEAHEILQAKYNQLRVAYRTKKAEKIHQRELSQHYTAQVKELGKTSAALEENLKIMLSALGENIDVAVGILTSHVFLSPCVVHPGPDLHLNPEAWFGAQQARLRWLQTQLRKLCLHSWKTADLPRTSKFGSTRTENSTADQSSQFTDATGKTSTLYKDMHYSKGSCIEEMPKTCMKKNYLYELSILDEKRSYANTPVKKKLNVSSVSFNTVSTSNIPHTEKASGSGTVHAVQDSRIEQLDDSNNPSCRTTHVTLSYNPNINQFSRSPKNLNEAERILTSRQRELSEAKYRQYKALINKLQRDLEYTLVYSPSIPSSMITTPERMPDYGHNLGESESSSVDPEGLVSEVQDSQSSSQRILVSQSQTEDSLQTQSPPLKDKDLPSVTEEVSEVQSLSSDTQVSSEGRDLSLKTELPSLKKGNTSDQACHSSSQKELPKQEEDNKVMIRANEPNGEGKAKDFLKEDRSNNGLDSDKDRDSLEEDNEEDFIRVLVESEAVGDDGMD